MRTLSTLLPISSRYLGIFGLYYIYLSARVIVQRLKLKEPREPTLVLVRDLIIKLKNGEQVENNNSIDPNKFDRLNKEIRAHANFNEYVPIMGVLSIINELNNVNSNILHGSLALLLFGRVLHHAGMLNKRGINNYRSTGIISTYLAIFIQSVACIYHFK